MQNITPQRIRNSSRTPTSTDESMTANFRADNCRAVSFSASILITRIPCRGLSNQKSLSEAQSLDLGSGNCEMYLRAIVSIMDSLQLGQSSTDADGITVGDLILGRGNRSVSRGGIEIRLTSSEFDLLWYLAARAGKVISRDELFDRILGFPYDGQNRTIDLRISRLNRKLERKGNQSRLIKSIRSEGYCLVVATPAAGAQQQEIGDQIGHC